MQYSEHGNKQEDENSTISFRIFLQSWSEFLTFRAERELSEKVGARRAPLCEEAFGHGAHPGLGLETVCEMRPPVRAVDVGIVSPSDV